MTVPRQRYLVERMLYEGPFGSTYLAHDRESGRRVAIKKSAPSPGADGEAERERFMREGQILCALKHPGICAFYDCYCDSTGYCLVTEYIQGESLAEYIQRVGTLSLLDLHELMLETLEILEYLHSQEPPVLHLDIKAENVRRAADGHFCLVDFDFARPRDSDAPCPARGCDASDDVHAWACTMFHAATGQVVPEGLPAVPSPRSLRPDLLLPWDTLLRKCFDRDRARRPTAGELYASFALIPRPRSVYPFPR